MSGVCERDLFPQQTIPRYFTITHRDVFLCTDFFFKGMQFMPYCQAYERDLFPPQTISRYLTITCGYFFFRFFFPWRVMPYVTRMNVICFLYRQSLNLSPLTSGEGGFIFLCVKGFLFFIASYSVCQMYKFGIFPLQTVSRSDNI